MPHAQISATLGIPVGSIGPSGNRVSHPDVFLGDGAVAPL